MADKYTIEGKKISIPYKLISSLGPAPVVCLPRELLKKGLLTKGKRYHITLTES